MVKMKQLGEKLVSHVNLMMNRMDRVPPSRKFLELLIKILFVSISVLWFIRILISIFV